MRLSSTICLSLPNILQVFVSDMLDDDIQYMGTKPAQRALSNSPFSTRQTLYAIVLHIEKSSADSPYELIFSRASTDVVHIGRLSSSEVEQWHGDSASVLFKCAVVSRSHAKIVFSDSGHAYIIDLKSHHGTHLRKPGDLVSRMLVPETPAQLAEGDIITFGKSVGSHADLVRPVVARVELRYRRADNLFRPLITPTSPIIRVDLTKGSPKSSSGRYGLYDSSSSSSDDGSSVISDHDSDIEEIPVSGDNSIPLQPRSSHNVEKGSNLTRASRVLKRLIPPVHAPPPGLSSERLQRQASNPSACYLSPLDLSEEYYPDSPIYSPYSPRSISPMFNMPSSPLINQTKDLDNGCVLPDSLSRVERSASSKSPDFNDDSDGVHILRNPKYMVISERSESDTRSKSSPPMDLGSSPAFSHHPSPGPDQANEPSIIGAYPKSRSSSPSATRPVPATHVEEVAASDKVEDVQADVDDHVVTDSDDDAEAEEEEEEEEEGGDADADADAEIDDAGEAEDAGIEAEAHHSPEPPVHPPPDHARDNVAPAGSHSSVSGVSGPPTSVVSKLQIGLTELQGEVEKLQIHRRKYKERFNTNVNKLSDKLSDMDERIADVNAQYIVLCEQVADAMDVDIPDLQAQVEALQKQTDALAPILDMTFEPPMHKREDVKASIQTLHDLVAGKWGGGNRRPDILLELN
ncbi:hypothetical protein L208DRAFT_423579 [Tricholoma matsutake]|nr:hypothetical protein L208DRAFT_423579 [Tricholoma matsutake 945]